MEFGICTGIEHAQTVYLAGYDYIECTVQSLNPELDDHEIGDTLKSFFSSPIPVKVFNVFLPGDLKITGENIDHERIKRYLKNTFYRVKQVGADTIVFGSGGARTLPDGFSRVKGEEQIVQFLDTAGDFADSTGITIAIEPLYRQASNLINTLFEAVTIAKRVDRYSIGVLADFFHMVEENDPLEALVTHKDFIRHIHVSDNYRPPGTGQFPFPEFVECLERANYNGRISIECVWDDFEKQAVTAGKFVKQKFISE